LGSQCNVILKHKCSQCHAWPMIRKYPLGYSWASRTATDIHVHNIHTYIHSYLWSEFLFLSLSSKWRQFLHKSWTGCWHRLPTHCSFYSGFSKASHETSIPWRSHVSSTHFIHSSIIFIHLGVSLALFFFFCNWLKIFIHAIPISV
jgi:hypothetical protein